MHNFTIKLANKRKIEFTREFLQDYKVLHEQNATKEVAKVLLEESDDQFNELLDRLNILIKMV